MIMNAAGVYDETPQQLYMLHASKADAVVIKSATILPRPGNEEPRLKFEIGPSTYRSSINSMGLPNLGIRRYVDEIVPELYNLNPNKPLVASISTAPDPCKEKCEKPDEHSAVGQYRTMIELYKKAPIRNLQINLSCPNIKGKPMVGNSPETVEEVLSLMKGYGRQWGVKVAPYNNDPILFKEIADIVLKHGPDTVVTINSVPLCMDVDIAARRKTIRPNDGYGGLGGTPALPVALAEVNRWYREIEKRELEYTEVVGCGGVTGLDSALKHIMAGASHLEIGTWLLTDGPKIFAELKRDLNQWKDDNGVTDWDDLIGVVERNPDVAEMIRYENESKKS